MLPMLHSESNVKVNSKDKITLSMIGHAPDAHYLERLLKQIKPITAQICFVNTDQKPDCHNVLKSSGIPFDYELMTFEKRNQFDFSKARNAARVMACKYSNTALWLDCDDIIEDIYQIPNAISKHEADAFAIKYNVSVSNPEILKIRLHNPNEWIWTNKVHEEIVPIKGTLKEKKIMLVRSCMIHHSPGERESHSDFHIELLKEECKEAPNQICYIGKEYFNSYRFDEAIPWLNKSILTHSSPYEIYNAYMMLGICYLNIEKSKKALAVFHDGLAHSPGRKEAYFYIAEYYASLGKIENIQRALAYILSCNAQIDSSAHVQNEYVYKTLCWRLEARLHLNTKNYKKAIHAANQASNPDKEILKIKKECSKAIEQNNISDGSSKHRNFT